MWKVDQNFLGDLMFLERLVKKSLLAELSPAVTWFLILLYALQALSKFKSFTFLKRESFFRIHLVRLLVTYGKFLYVCTSSEHRLTCSHIHLYMNYQVLSLFKDIEIADIYKQFHTCVY